MLKISTQLIIIQYLANRKSKIKQCKIYFKTGHQNDPNKSVSNHFTIKCDKFNSTGCPPLPKDIKIILISQNLHILNNLLYTFHINIMRNNTRF